jgi:hypothetical protein
MKMPEYFKTAVVFIISFSVSVEVFLQPCVQIKNIPAKSTADSLCKNIEID